MTGLLRSSDDGPVARCRHCGAVAAGPCARCRAPVCADCCVLTDGGATTFAICVGCERRGGASLARPWLGLLGWLAAVLLALAVVAVLVTLAAGCGKERDRAAAAADDDTRWARIEAPSHPAASRRRSPSTKRSTDPAPRAKNSDGSASSSSITTGAPSGPRARSTRP